MQAQGVPLSFGPLALCPDFASTNGTLASILEEYKTRTSSGLLVVAEKIILGRRDHGYRVN
jgi:hypothetical protein